MLYDFEVAFYSPIVGYSKTVVSATDSVAARNLVKAQYGATQILSVRKL